MLSCCQVYFHSLIDYFHYVFSVQSLLFNKSAVSPPDAALAEGKEQTLKHESLKMSCLSCREKKLKI